MGLLEQILTVYLICVMLVLTVAVFVTGFLFFFNLYKQTKEINQNDKW